jgi:hypothetical protein
MKKAMGHNDGAHMVWQKSPFFYPKRESHHDYENGEQLVFRFIERTLH